MTSITRHRFSAALAVGVLALVAVSCGGSDDSSSSPDPQEVSTDSTGVTVDTVDTVDAVEGGDTAAADEAAGAVAEAVGAEEVLSEVGIDTIAFALSSALGGAYEVLDETTIRLTLDGSLESDAMIACIVAGGVVQPGTTVIVNYPDGEQTCE